MLKGRSARIICTLDQPDWYYRLWYGQPSHRAMKNMTLGFCGISPVSITSIGPLRLSSEAFRQKWLGKVEALGRRQR